MKLKTVVLNDNEYLILKNLYYNKKNYCVLSNINDIKDILVKRLVSAEDGTQYFESLDSREEFYEVLSQLDINSRKKNQDDKFLPIGTVCLLKDASKKVMINGYLVSDGKDGDTLYDYSAVMFPSGNSIKLAFNHNQISKIISIGYQDAETLAYIQELNSIEPIIRMVFDNKKNEVTQDV